MYDIQAAHAGFMFDAVYGISMTISNSSALQSSSFIPIVIAREASRLLHTNSAIGQL
jgi:hypothetical protein